MADVEIDEIVFKYYDSILPGSHPTQRYEDSLSEDGKSVFEGSDDEIPKGDDRIGVCYYTQITGYSVSKAVIAFYKSVVPPGQAERFRMDDNVETYRNMGNKSYRGDVYVVATETKMSELAQMIREASGRLRLSAKLNWDVKGVGGRHPWTSDHTKIEKDYYEYILLPKEREKRAREKATEKASLAEASIASAKHAGEPFNEKGEYEIAVGMLGRRVGGHTMTDAMVKITKIDEVYQLVINAMNDVTLYQCRLDSISNVVPMKDKSLGSHAMGKKSPDSVMIKIVGNDGPVVRFGDGIQSTFIEALTFARPQIKIDPQLRGGETGGASGVKGGGRTRRTRRRSTKRTRRRKSSKKRKSKKRKSKRRR
jgi:hypothetical protein